MSNEAEHDSKHKENDAAIEKPRENEETQDKVLENADKKDKFMRLLGGKKHKNQSDADEWMHKLRNKEEEQKLAKGLESQFNHSLEHKLTGKARRKQGFGFEERPAEAPSGENRRERSRSPINKRDAKNSEEEVKDKESKPSVSESRENARKKFFMQFQKASS